MITSAMPEEQPLAMPVQDFHAWTKAQEAGPDKAIADKNTMLARLAVFGGGLIITALGIYQMYRVVELGGITPLEMLLLAFFSVNFSWIAISFASGVVGFLSLLFNKTQPIQTPVELKARTAVVMPIYNEAPSRVFAAMKAMAEDVTRSGLAAHFDFFFLSDTTDPDAWIAEENAYFSLKDQFPKECNLYYRHRLKNTARKAGNIADFVSRWGGAYEHMLVLDADSVMTGETIIALAGMMEADPKSGIIQTLPLIINRNTLFARVQQFAGRIYGPVIAEGLRLWMGRDGNYWGHNAIIRTKAFAAHCAMPDLKGKPPFGGHIMSHDFVEAALIRRDGWSVTMVRGVVGSYEESPPSLIDLSARDRRWCQGNLQHMRVIGARGFRLATRQHFATGIMSYLASPFWLMQLLVGTLIALQAHFIRPEYFTSDFSLFPAWPRFDAERALGLFIATMAILLAPKFFGMIVSMLDKNTRKQSGGVFGLFFSTLFEILLSALLAPIMMLIQSGAVLQILMGRDTGWKPQRRDDGSVPLKDIWRRHWSHVALGVFAGVASLSITFSLFAWMAPTIIGLVLAVWLSWSTAQVKWGLAMKRLHLLLIPEEVNPPRVVTESNEGQKRLTSYDEVDGIKLLHQNQWMRDHHQALLPEASARKRGTFLQEHIMAEARLNEADSIEEASQWLKGKERAIVMQDRALLAILASLKENKIEAQLPIAETVSKS